MNKELERLKNLDLHVDESQLLSIPPETFFVAYWQNSKVFVQLSIHDEDTYLSIIHELQTQKKGFTTFYKSKHIYSSNIDCSIRKKSNLPNL